MSRLRSLVAALLGLAVPGVLLAGTAPWKAWQSDASLVTATILGAGSVITSRSGGTADAPDTAEGSVGRIDASWTPKFLAPPDQVKARLGLSIGLEVRVEGREFLAVVPLRTRVTHPPIVTPDNGKATTVDEWDSPMNARFPRFTGWRFDHRWELVPGKWTIDVLSGEQVIASQEFQVTVATR